MRRLVLLTAALWAPAPARAEPPPPPAVIALVRGVEQAVNDRSAERVDRAVDRAALADRALEGLELPVGRRLVIARDLRASLHLGAMLAGAVGSGGHYRFLAWRRDRAGQRTALFRAVEDRGGLNYHELVLSEPASGTPAIVDAYAHRSGELLSATLGRSCRRQVYAQRGWYDLVEPAARLDVIIERGWYADGLAYFERLPAGARNDRTLLLQRLLCAGFVSPEAVDEAWADLRRAFPADPGADLFVLSGLLERGRYDDALAAIERLRVAVYADPYLDVLAARALLQVGGLDRARARLERAIEAEPSLEPAWRLRLRVALALHEHDQAARALTVLQRRFGYQFQNVADDADYAAFVGSDEYQRWAAGR